MNTKTRLILIVALLGIVAVVLAVVFMPRGQALTPATTPPPTTEPSGTTGASAASGATIPPDETALLATSETTAETIPLTGATVEPGTPTATPAPTPTLTKEEILIQEIQDNNPQSAPSVDQCSTILETEPWCSVIKSAVYITRPEWEELFPQTEFFLVKYDLYGGEFTQQRNRLIVEQGSQRYTAKTFDRLLAVNGITITDENRELVARALVLMTLPDYLKEEITFSELTEGDWPAPLDFRYNHTLTVWTKIQGLNIGYHFLFDQGYLRMIRGIVSAYNVGDHIDVPFEKLPVPSQEAFSYSYWGR